MLELLLFRSFILPENLMELSCYKKEERVSDKRKDMIMDEEQPTNEACIRGYGFNTKPWRKNYN